MTKNEHHFCRVCGLDQGDFLPWGESGLNASHAICDCCGTEFGYEDCIVEACRAARERWLQRGADWFSPKERPQDWDMKKQLEQVPERFR